MSLPHIEVRKAVQACHLKWQLQGGCRRPFVDLRKYDHLPPKLDRLVSGVDQLRLCVTPQFLERNRGQLQSLAGRVNLKCFVVLPPLPRGTFL